jgi:hypothetical protein
VSRSRDGGRSWTIVGHFPEAPETGKAFVPFGNIERGADGVLRVAAYSYARGLPPPRVDPCYAISSNDDGVTWTVGPLINATEANETDLLHVGEGRWLAAVRNLGRGPVHQSHSLDLYAWQEGGGPWRKVSELTGPGQHPGDLLKLSDGRILVTYGDRRGSFSGVNAKISSDGGTTWSPEFRIAGVFARNDSGYPSSVQLPDGTIVTAYYANGSDKYPGYQMGVVRWRLDP